MDSLFFNLAVFLFMVPVAFWCYRFAEGPNSSRPGLGNRGDARKNALEQGWFFRTVEPSILFLSFRLAQLPIGEFRNRLDQKIKLSGTWLGLSADEFIAFSILSCLLAAGTGGLLGTLTGQGLWLSAPAGFLGALLPNLEMEASRAKRHLSINRGLPGAIDLAALCVGAGLDFPSALRHSSEQLEDKDELKKEFLQIRRELSLGHTRKRALESFAVRAETPAVVDFVAAVVQAEQKGTPLKEVLRIQGKVLRMRRSVMAEEAAARASVLMMLPLLMIFGCVFLLLLGPFIVNMLESGF